MLKHYHAFLGVLVVGLAFLCVFQIVKITEEKYLAQEYQKELREVSRMTLTIENPENNFSLREVEEIAKENGFVNKGNVAYVEVPSTEVAER